MIRAIVFDLDGTLVQTERLKALSYARAAVQLRSQDFTEAEVVEAFKEVVGLPRRGVSLALLAQFGLEKAARS
jgi:beta-phosphoglucomutase